MTQEELDFYWSLKRKKKIKNKDIAAAIGASQALVSLYMNGKCQISQEKERLLKEFIAETNNTKIITIKVNID